MLRKMIRFLNDHMITREFLMVPVIYIRDKILDLKGKPLIKKSRPMLRELKGIHESERCFVIGNGPSLTTDDLEKLNGEVCFAANRIYDIYPHTTWRPTYYGIQDIYVLDEISSEVEKEETGARLRFVVGNRPERICDEMKTDTKNRFFYLGSCLSKFIPIQFSRDCSKKFGQGGTITYAMIQLAVYMGFKEIYLLGVDHNYGSYVDEEGNYDSQAHAKSHFEWQKQYKKLHVPNTKLDSNWVVMSRAYMTAKTYCDRYGIKICNATRGGKLEIFDRVDLDSLL